MQTVIVTNNGCDYVLLVDGQDKVLTAWMAGKEEVLDFLRDGDDAAQWDIAGVGDTADGDRELDQIADYGEEYGRNGVIDSESRAEFWGVPTQMSFRAVYKAGSAQFCQAIGVTSTSKRLLTATLAERGIALTDVDLVPVED